MKELIRHILKEQSSKLDLLKIIQNEDIFDAADLVGGIHNLRKIFKDNPDVVEKLDSFNGRLDLIYHSRKEYIEFPVRFEIVGKGVNIPKTNSWPIVNLIYDDSNLSESEKKLFEQFVYDTIEDLNITHVDIKPEAKKMFRERGDYMGYKYVNGRNWKSLDHDIRYEDDDIKNIHREYYTKSYMNESKVLQENEQDPTQKILNFLRRRYKVEEKDIGWEDNPILIKSITFEVDGERYGISKFQNKREQIADIIYMLINHEVIEQIDPYGRKLDPYTQKVIRAVKLFINQVMSDKSDINESKDETQNKDVNLIKQMIYDLFDEVTSIEVSEYDDKPMLTINLISDSNAANKNTWYDEHISDEIMQLTGGHLVVCPYWVFSSDFRRKIADVYINTKVTRI